MAARMTYIPVILTATALVVMPAFAEKASKKKAAPAKAHASHTQRPTGAIYSWDGRYLGTDPDPNIRFQLMRDQNQPHD